MRKTTAAVLAAFSSYGWSQQLVAVAPEADPSGFGIIVVVALAAGGLVFLKTKKPEVFDKLVAKIKRKKPQPSAPVAQYTVPPIVVERSEPTFNEPTLPQMATQPSPPMYSWLITENDQLRTRVAQLERQLAEAARPAPVPSIPADFAGFLKA